MLDVETTGLDVERDRIVSIGAVRLHGSRLYSSRLLDQLVNPGIPIPERSAAIHGVTDAMVSAAPSFAQMAADVTALIAGTVVVGHNIAFDLAVLRHEARRAPPPWSEPLALDTMLLAAALEGGAARDLNLEALASRLAVDVHGRHTALGDCLVTAEIYARLFPCSRSAACVPAARPAPSRRRPKPSSAGNAPPAGDGGAALPLTAAASPAGFPAQGDRDHARLREHPIGDTVGDVLPVIEQGDAVGEISDPLHVVLDPDHRHADLVLDAQDEARQVLLFLAVEAGRGLVEEQDTRLHGRRPGELD